jgi:sulfate adenylyltransferase subunit 1
MSHQSELIEQDILAYLKQQEHKELVKCLTCGSVDDGKSTLIGRLLHDSKMIFEDQLAAIENDSKKSGTTGDRIDLALLVDGLQSEREQGITIDVAYRYFSTDKRKFIIADTPGHEQYTRNMATGASNCDVAIILVDARYGVQVQTRRHSFICSLLGIKHVVVAINKMDLVDFSESRFTQIKADYQAFVKSLNIPDVRFVPMSALEGDNVVNRSTNTPWYKGETLMTLLESIEIHKVDQQQDFRYQVQYVNRPHLNFRGFAGTIGSGSITVGDNIVAMPSGKTSKVASIVDFDGQLTEASAPQAVTITLEDEIDISRGEMMVKADALPQSSHSLLADVVWMHEDALIAGREYCIKHGSKMTTGHLTAIDYRVDVNTMKHNDASELGLNEIGRCFFHVNEKLHFDAYDVNKSTGAFIIIDRITNVTVGAAMIVKAIDEQQKENPYSDFEMEFNALVCKHFPHWGARDLSGLQNKS